ncbi:MAG: aminotransferase class IV, partial [Anaerolineae bacterium]
MAIQKSEKIWLDGRLVPWQDATVHVAAHVLHYGSSVFEGIRAYESDNGPAIFCLRPHIDRLFNSSKIYRLEIPYTREEIEGAIVDTVRANGHRACYIRPLVFRGFGGLGLDPRSCPVQVAIITFAWGRYLGAEAIEQGID